MYILSPHSCHIRGERPRQYLVHGVELSIKQGRIQALYQCVDMWFFACPRPIIAENMQARSLRSEIQQYCQVTEDGQMWVCEACTLFNSLAYIQCSECLSYNNHWKGVLDALNLPYQTRELNLEATFKGLFRSLQKPQGPGESFWDILSATGFLHISNSWKCRCGTVSAANRITCSHCFTRNASLQSLLDLISFPYTLSVSEQAAEDPIPISLLEPLEHQLHVSPGLVVWTCPQCTIENSTEYIQCKGCHWINERLEEVNNLLGVPVLRVQVSTLLRLFTGIREGNGEDSGSQVFKGKLETLTGLKEPYQMWTCPSCTLINSYEYPQCRLCPYINTGIQDILRVLNIPRKCRKKSIVTLAKEAYHGVLDQVQSATVCPICETTIPSIDLHPLTACQHVFHPACLREHILETTQVTVTCPNAACQEEISTQDITRLLTAYEFERYSEATLKRYFASQGDKIRACPTPDCPFSFIFDGEKEFTCLHCHKSYCLRCHSNAHAGEACEERHLRLQYLPLALEPMKQCPVCKYGFKEKDGGVCANCKVTYCLKCHVAHPYFTCAEYFRTLRKEENEALFLQFATGSRFKICGRCKVWVEKQTGCNHITCRCGHQFCYICGKDWLLGQCGSHQFQ